VKTEFQTTELRSNDIITSFNLKHVTFKDRKSSVYNPVSVRQVISSSFIESFACGVLRKGEMRRDNISLGAIHASNKDRV
jgi:hypothetical protein